MTNRQRTIRGIYTHLKEVEEDAPTLCTRLDFFSGAFLAMVYKNPFGVIGIPNHPASAGTKFFQGGQNLKRIPIMPLKTLC